MVENPFLGGTSQPISPSRKLPPQVIIIELLFSIYTEVADNLSNQNNQSLNLSDQDELVGVTRGHTVPRIFISALEDNNDQTGAARRDRSGQASK